MDPIDEYFNIIDNEISQIKDLDSLLDRILSEARRFTQSDAGSIFLAEGNKLKFSYVQNDSLFKDLTQKKHLYSNHEIEIDEKSIAGYVALTGKSLVIDDVYQIKNNVPYQFNRSFDESSNYKTQSMLVVPLKIGQNKIVGLMQLINNTLPGQQMVGTYTKKHEVMANLFASQAALAIERAKVTRTLILRMIKMAELRDPKETGAHANRVGSYSIEIYNQWALSNHVPDREIHRMKDTLRIAAMLHDVGKVAIPDTILKKPGKLTDEEFNAMKVHTLAGAQLFGEPTSDLDIMACEIALNHHEKWDGTGYPGTSPQNSLSTETRNRGKSRDEIPLWGRIVALSDVYDALISKRCYKEAWSEEKTLDCIQEQSGKHFDPDLVVAFLSIYDVIKAIRDKYSEGL
jgi:HD-GYP domain-containing protein (c-di-GMP phosphodiesterase class II)